VLSSSPALEDHLGVLGPTFMTKALSHARSVLTKITKGKGAIVNESAEVRLLSERIQLHSQIAQAYDALLN